MHRFRNGCFGTNLSLSINQSFQNVPPHEVSTAVTTVQTSFEPVVNIPALFSFVLIAAVFSILQFRINAVARAAERREQALKTLRTVKSLELSSSDVGEESQRPSEYDVSMALADYEDALREEENLRTVIPGVARIVAPNDPNRREEDVEAARRFLGMNIGDVSEGNAGENSEEAAPKKGFSNGSLAILAAVALSQLALLYMLSFDPMATSQVFTSVGGEPPSDLPFSSW